MIPFIKPKRLKPGGRIAVIAPSSPVEPDQLDIAADSVRFLGLKPIFYPSATMTHGYLSGPDEIRAADVNRAFSDASIDGIFCIRGGYGTTRILNRIDFPMIAKNPKVFLGYSDITGLHNAINQRCHFITFHAPMPARGWSTLDSVTLGSLADNLFSGIATGLSPMIEGECLEIINEGAAIGPITGGNLSLLAATLGSPYEIDTKNKILFLEEVDEEIYKVDRNLTALALANKFDDCAGILLGTWPGVGSTASEPKKSLTLQQVFDEVIKPYGKPTMNNFRAGHIYPQITIPLGIRTKLDANQGTVELLESATQ